MAEINWDFLPQEIQTFIIWFLEIPDILQLRQVSKAFRLCCDNEMKWKEQVYLISGVTTLPFPEYSWKSLYISYNKKFVWSSELKGPHIELDSFLRNATSLKEGGWSSDRINSFYWQTVLSKFPITPEFNYVEFILTEYDSKMVNTRGVMIGVDIVKPEVSSTHSPCWIGLNSGWGYAAKSGELFIPGSRSNHLSRPFNKGYKQGDTIGIFFDFNRKAIAFFVNNELHGIEKIEDKYWRPNFHFAFASAHGNTSVKFQVPQFRKECLLKYQKYISDRSFRQVPIQTD